MNKAVSAPDMRPKQETGPLARQHALPLLLDADNRRAIPLRPIMLDDSPGGMRESDIQELIHSHPVCLPIAEIDPIFVGAVPICTGLLTPSGPIDNFLVTPSGLPVLVLCKLWRNPEGRREVIGRVLDHARELSNWTSSDMQREVSRRLKREGNSMLDLVRQAGHDVDEIAFNDALTFNLRHGRILLLIVGDGIREGGEAIAEYLQAHIGLHFSLGLVEMPVFQLPDGQWLIAPRILTRTSVITRHVVSVAQGHGLTDLPHATPALDQDREVNALGEERERFWADFLSGLSLDDPAQPVPRPSRQGAIYFMLPAPGGSCWLTVYRDIRNGEVGIFLASLRGSAGETAMLSIIHDQWDAVSGELGGSARLDDYDGRPRLIDRLSGLALYESSGQEMAHAWLRQRVNLFVNALRPRVRSIIAQQ